MVLYMRKPWGADAAVGTSMMFLCSEGSAVTFVEAAREKEVGMWIRRISRRLGGG